MSNYDVERALITKVIEESDLKTVLRQKVTKKFFSDDDARDVFGWMLKHYHKYRKVPSLKFVQREFPDFEPEDTDDDMVALIDEVKRTKLYTDLSKTVKEIVEATKEDPEDGLSILRKKAGELSILHSNVNDEDITKSIEAIKEEYERLEEGEGNVGIPFPWPYLNEITLGMHAGELIGIFARPKSLKTWVALHIANYVHETHGIVPAFFSCEMPLEQIRRRLAAIRARVPYQLYRSGKLDKDQKKRFFRALKELEESPPFMLCEVGTTGEEAITEIRAKCEEYEAEIAIVDGFYFLMEDDTHRAFRVLTRGFVKRIAEPLKIPVVGTTQGNRDSEKVRGQSTRGVAFGDSLAQDCHLLINLIREPQHREMQELLLTLPALREAEGGTFSIHAKPAYDFSQKHVMEAAEAQEALESTDDGGDIM